MEWANIYKRNHKWGCQPTTPKFKNCQVKTKQPKKINKGHESQDQLFNDHFTIKELNTSTNIIEKLKVAGVDIRTEQIKYMGLRDS